MPKQPNTIFNSENVLTGRTQIESSIGGTGIAPIGAVMAWLKSEANTPSLPEGWVECNGQTLNDPQSSFHNATIPDLNGNSGTQRFLRGSTTSGTTGGSENHSHTASASFSEVDSAGTGAWAADENVGAGGSTLTITTSTLPSYYEVVWIMRVR